jgi:hypothetical protein
MEQQLQEVLDIQEMAFQIQVVAAVAVTEKTRHKDLLQVVVA